MSASPPALDRLRDTLLEPLSHDKQDRWLVAAAEALRDATGAAAAFVVAAPAGEGTRFASSDFAPGELGILETYARADPGELRTRDDVIDGYYRALRDRPERTEISPCASARGFDARRLQASRIFQEFALPLKVPGSFGLFHRGADGEFLVNAVFPRLDARPFGDRAPRRIAPALAALGAGVRVSARLQAQRRAVERLIDALGDAAFVFDADGRRLLARNPAAAAVERDAAGAWAALDAVVRRVAASAAWPVRDARGGRRAPEPLPPAIEWRGAGPAGVRLRLAAVRLPAGLVARAEAVVVLATRLDRALPAERELAARHGLTPREAQVARLLAEGRDNAAIATHLAMSRHTVRAHAERVFAKLGVHSRKALGLRLLDL